MCCKRQKIHNEETDNEQLDNGGNDRPKSHTEQEQLANYFQQQESMDMKAKTTSALRDRYKAPSTRKQMFEILRGKGLYKKFPKKEFTQFNSWLQSPSGGGLKCTQEIVSEVNR